MLTQETKRKIDSARQILVGKVPDPKTQVGQITTALIYKFMDDMDKEAIELGGKARFFTKGFQKYAWTKLFDPKLGGHERLELYSEAVARMSQNPHIPQLFRDIFKDAFLPYRSPETLTLFLKEINGFTYDHSEELGNAFEYLLSILGSQGDAGQFRTPRHIIDFIVDVIEPKKGDTILDPACGTAGFLISAYKNILKQQKDKPLTPDEKKKLMNNLVGYDISPDMVKLSKVNMYLHGFADPKIFDYDTLVSDEKWSESYDVILANPPFFSAKEGSLQPHKRFSIKSNKSEVLFVDYIKEHLRPSGRAGVIVPEGIIFQSSGAYKQLRKMLVEDGLFAVVSLPQGVFNPYSGVKTSVLFFDNTVAKKTNKILFVRVLNDGFDLGAQRRPIDRNDLVRPDNEVDATKVLKAQRIAIETGTKNPLLQENSLFAYEISKEQIARSGDYNLSGERYRVDNLGEQKNQKWTTVELDEVIDLNFGTRITKKNEEGSLYPVYGGGGESFRTDTFNREDEVVISRFAMSENCVRFVSGKFFMLDSGFTFSVKPEKVDEVLKEFVGKYLLSIQQKIYACARGHAQKNIDVKAFKKIKIPLPPIEVQKEIVEQIEVKQNAIEHAKAIIENLERERRYFSQSLRKLGDIPMVELGKISKIIGGGTPSKEKDVYWKNGTVKWLSAKYIGDDQNVKGYDLITKEAVKESATKIAPKNSTILVSRVSVGKFAFADQDYAINQDLTAIIPNGGVEPKYILYASFDLAERISKDAQGVGVRGVTRDYIEKLKIPLPSLETQKQMVEEMEKEEETIASNRKLIEVMEKKIDAVLSEI